MLIFDIFEWINKINYKGDIGGEKHLRSPDFSLADNFEEMVCELADLKSFLVFSYAEIYFESFIFEVSAKSKNIVFPHPNVSRPFIFTSPRHLSRLVFTCSTRW